MNRLRCILRRRHAWGWIELHVVGFGRYHLWACQRCGWLCKRDRAQMGGFFV